MARHTALGWLVLAATVLAVGAAAAAPNIVLITADTFRPDHLGCDGYERPTSPHLDSLCAEGVFFERAYTTSGWTAPGLISIHTSLYAPAHGVDVRGRSLDPSVTTLAEALRAGGYRAPDLFFLTDIPNFANLGLEPYPDRQRLVHHEDETEILFHWLETEAEASDRPFFLYYHYRGLHQPYDPLPEYEEPFLRQAWGTPWNPWTWVRRFVAAEKVALVRREVMLPRGIIDFAPWDRGWVRALYDGQVRQMDDRLFGRLRRVLRERGLDRNTIVVVAADHGEELLERGLIGHVSTFKEARLDEEIIRIPLIFWWPGQLPAGQRVHDLVQAIDVMPTLLALAGVEVPSGVQGRSLVPLVRGQSLPPRPIFLETSGGGYTANLAQYTQRARAVRTARWKLVWYTPQERLELYDMASEEGENRNLAAQRPALADSLRAVLAAWVEANPKAVAPPLAETVTPGGASEGHLQVFVPADGDTVDFAGAGQTIRLSWSGAADAAYTAEYIIGRGAYHLEGQLEVDSSTPAYGPFHADFWNSLALYNPYRFRVYPTGRPELASDWVTFHLAPVGGGDGSLTGAVSTWLAVTGAASVRTLGELGDLAAGLALGLVDLGLWLSRIPAADATAWALLAAIAGALVWPRLQPLGEARLRAWGLAVVYVGGVYATVPVFPAVWARLREHTGQAAIAHLGTILVGGVGLWLAGRATRRLRRRGLLTGGGLSRVALLGLLLAAYAWLLVTFGRFPAERLHLLEYGGMAFLLHRALRLDLPPRVARAAALALTAVIGFGDETLQWILPNRFFELKDAGLNVVAAALGLALTGLAGLHGDGDR